MTERLNNGEVVMDTLPQILVTYLANCGIAVSEIACAAEVTRATVYNWLKGVDARNAALAKLIKAYNLNNHSLDEIYPRAKMLSGRFFDPDSLGQLATIETVLKRYNDLVHANLAEVNEDGGTPVDGFKSPLLKQYGKALFKSGYSNEKHGGSLILVCTSSEQAEHAKHIWNEWVEGCRYSYEQDMNVMKRLGIDITGEPQYGVYLSDIISAFPILERSAKEIFGGSTSLRLDVDDESLTDKEAALLYFEWERYDRESPVDYLFYWVSDVDGRRACAKVFSAIKDGISKGDKSLTLFVHHGYFHEEICTGEDEDDPSKSAFLTEDDVINKAIPVNRRLEGFRYPEDAEYNRTGEIDGLRVFVCPNGSIASDVFDVPDELPKEAFMFLFPILGYKIKIQCDKVGRSVHSVIVSW